MLELEHNGFYPLTEEHLRLYVPARPGIYTLAVRLVDGTHQSFFTSQSDNLYSSLQKLQRGDRLHLPLVAMTYMERFQTYFTYFLILGAEQRQEIEKLLTHTSDPVLKLRVVHANS